MADWHSCFTIMIVDRSLIRECVQISASGHADADQSGANFFRFHFQSVPNETESATGQNSLSGQLTEVILDLYLSVFVKGLKQSGLRRASQL